MSPPTAKTDHSSLDAKLALRREFLRRYHSETPPRVFDACQGDGTLWARLREEFAVASYWGVDLKARRGRLKIDAARVLAQEGWTEDIVDIDTYGSPWSVWEAMLPNVRRPVTVFLTVGLVTVGGGNFDRSILRYLGATFHRIRPTNAMVAKLAILSIPYALHQADAHGLQLVEAIEAIPPRQGNAHYIGVRLEPSG